MLIVADSSPVNILVRIGHAHVLPGLFERVLIPPQVLSELTASESPQVVREFVARRPEWLEVRSPTLIRDLSGIDPGEIAAISLAAELSVSLLIDDYDGRVAAKRLGLHVIGTLGALELADQRDLAELPSALAAIQRTDFRLSKELIDAALARRQRR